MRRKKKNAGLCIFNRNHNRGPKKIYILEGFQKGPFFAKKDAFLHVPQNGQKITKFSTFYKFYKN